MASYWVITSAPFNLHRQFGIFNDSSQAKEMARQLNKYDPNFRGRGMKAEKADSSGMPLNWKKKENPSMLSEMELVAKRALGISKRRNSSTTTLEDAEDLARQFHGREPRETLEIAEREAYFSNLAIIGELEELCILLPDNKKSIPISFKPGKLIGVSTGDSEDCVWVCAANTHQIEFIDGSQELEFDANICKQLGIEEEMLEKQYVKVGPVYAITYYTDKRHLEGPRYQEKGTSYEHHFGEEGGTLPELWYDILNDRLLLVGGSYTIETEGIKN